MNFHTLYLSAFLVLIAVSFPTSLIGIFFTLNLGRINTILPNSLSYLLFTVMVFFTGYIGNINYNINIYFVILAFIMSFVCIGIEIFEAMLMHFIKYKFWITNIEVHEIIARKNILFDIIVIFIGALCEEIIFRQVFFNITYNVFGINIYIIVVLSAFIYSINHIYFGANAVFQKFIVGIIYSLLFVYSSFSIIAPVITHFLQNFILYLLSFRRNKREALN
ncbi:type II CAAX endopeptidase family protein [Brachyspira hyodysenteriae]|uniref:CPBP family intramembrane glutamic endopeptidase n=1 Tax=Brachyspira hyodysenteriae TaxID=159 RepID=UPI0022CD9495|nr:type II CAAX endopeptidase family protein [Brachyspira hyodysenteriae]MCZ9892899.1 CPBP family intramembrane metalloprotease [Brachyspira hyodysenteriae]MCZ9990446.1 CPBP family intramembrane metalloprotease [Brachyspira hyodysenteriae]MCZ9998813.1 CPBP family intramembrane metalloprotease [Brachyspira hyodysenteriae]MCZ9999884.1 CPBP family intramembrane metalloprotease [Brachyspira hyodysenteriae]MDA0030079.1 CPBP family intramembrane metalloprotease [Brachyspira hyodysenteriae]